MSKTTKPLKAMLDRERRGCANIRKKLPNNGRREIHKRTRWTDLNGKELKGLKNLVDRIICLL